MSDQQNKANPTGERFLFCITPTNLAISAPCGCSLQTGTQIVALIFIASTITPFFTAFQYGSLWNLLYYGIVFGLYFLAGISALYSTYTFTYEYAQTANYIYNFLFMMNVLDNIIMAALILSGYILPLGYEIPAFTQGMYYIAAVTTILLIHMYMIWVVYSYMVHVKNNRKGLVQGDIYKTYDDYERGVELPNRN
jgi:hypothetical protein